MKDKNLDTWIHAPFNAGDPFLEQIPKEVQDDLLRQCRIIEVDAGKMILRRGALADKFFIVQSGKVTELGRKHKGRYAEEIPVNKGYCFGEASILSKIPLSRSFRADTFCTLLYMDAEEFLYFLISQPGVLVVLYRIMADRIRKQHKALDSLLKPGVKGSLSTQSFMDITQSFQNSMRTGLVTLESSGQKCVIGFNDGQMVYAKTATAEGNDVLDLVMGWEEGHFSYEHTERIETLNVVGDTMSLMLDALRRLDEAGR
jgi:CRP-like cAMP-binding protein